jgi:cell wall-associated NlpC family hydrolase
VLLALIGAAAALRSGSGRTSAPRRAKTGLAANTSSVAGTYAKAGTPVGTGKTAASSGKQRVGTGTPGSRAGAGAAHAHPPTAAGASATGAGGAAHGTVAVAEVRDPEESKSFPLPPSVHHRSASSPSVAGEAAVAPGAASDAQIRKELGEEQHAEAQARAAQQRVLTPVAGGFSVGGNGTIPIPSGIPEAVQRVIAGGNAIADFPYIWGGGHGSFIANGYDCSGSVSYALAAGGLLSAPLVSGDLANWGEAGPGRWITIYANAGHTFMDVDGMWFDTAGRSGPYASRWLVSTPSLAGYAVRHPPGL